MMLHCILSSALPMVLSAGHLFFFFVKKKYLNSFIEIQFIYCTSHSFEVHDSIAIILGASEL